MGAGAAPTATERETSGTTPGAANGQPDRAVRDSRAGGSQVRGAARRRGWHGIGGDAGEFDLIAAVAYRAHGRAGGTVIVEGADPIYATACATSRSTSYRMSS
jgi:hypothetical protein